VGSSELAVPAPLNEIGRVIRQATELLRRQDIICEERGVQLPATLSTIVHQLLAGSDELGRDKAETGIVRLKSRSHDSVAECCSNTLLRTEPLRGEVSGLIRPLHAHPAR